MRPDEPQEPYGGTELTSQCRVQHLFVLQKFVLKQGRLFADSCCNEGHVRWRLRDGAKVRY